MTQNQNQQQQQQQQQQLHHHAQQSNPNINCYNNTLGNNNTPDPLNVLNDPTMASQAASQVVGVQHGQFASRPSVTPPSWVH